MAGLAIPQQGGLALVGDADRRNVRRFQSGPGERAPRDAELRAPDVLRVVLHPARLGKNLTEFLLRLRAHAAVFGKYDGAGTGGALVEGEDVLHIIVLFRFA